MEITIIDLFGLLLAHLIGDFFLQSDETAKNKSSDDMVLTRHVAIYTMPFAFIAFFTFPFILAIGFLAVNAVLHYATDYVSSRVAKSYWEKEDRHNFFVTIGIDQFIHIMSLTWTFAFLKSLMT